MRGRKPELADNKVAALPLNVEPQALHIAQAKDMLKAGMLNAAERKVWTRVAPQLVMLGRLRPHFVDALCEYCRVVVRLANARKYLDKDDWTYVTTGRNGDQFKSRPEVAQLNDDWRKWRTLVGEFGLAPSAERGLANDTQGDLFDEFEAL